MLVEKCHACGKKLIIQEKNHKWGLIGDSYVKSSKESRHIVYGSRHGNKLTYRIKPVYYCSRECKTAGRL